MVCRGGLAHILGKPRRRFVSHYAATALGHIGPPAVPALAAGLTHAHPQLKMEILGQLGLLETNAVAAIPKLIECSGDQDSRVRSGAVMALGEIGEQPERVVPMIAPRLRDPNWIIRRCAAYTLGNLGGQAAFDAFQDATRQPSVWLSAQPCRPAGVCYFEFDGHRCGLGQRPHASCQAR